MPGTMPPMPLLQKPAPLFVKLCRPVGLICTRRRRAQGNAAPAVLDNSVLQLCTLVVPVYFVYIYSIHTWKRQVFDLCFMCALCAFACTRSGGVQESVPPADLTRPSRPPCLYACLSER